jgi:hypothetical protein
MAAKVVGLGIKKVGLFCSFGRVEPFLKDQWTGWAIGAKQRKVLERPSVFPTYVT